MRLSRRGTKFIAHFEGFVDHAYRPVAGEQWLTIGYGHYGPDVKPGATITKRRARKLLRKDTRSAGDAVSRLVHARITQAQFDALVSFTFNVGEGAFAGSTLLRLLNQGHRRQAAAQFGAWVNGASGPLPGLVIRRDAERRLFLTGNYS